MSGIDYRFWANYIYQISRNHCNPKTSSVLELAAGNGNLTKYLHKKFSYYLVSDKSISMLKNFKIKDVDIICFDMISPPIKRKFDLIICSFDSINYILSKQKLRVLFRNLFNLLKPDGVFLFDVGLTRNSIHHQKYASKKGKYRNINFTRLSVFSPKSRIHKNTFEFQFEDGTKIVEIHRQKIFDLNELFDIIDKTNLYVVDCFNAFTFEHCKENNFRAQFVVKRKI